MKLLILVFSFLALASASWEPIHEKYHGPLHYPKIHKGVPVEPAAVQHAREAHLMALSQASNGHGYSHHDHHEEEHKWEGAQHYPVIHKGVPVEPAEVQHAREAHLKALSHASHNDQSQGYDHHHGHNEEGHKWHGRMHIPKIYKGVPVEPVEVQHARAAHLKAFSGIQSTGGDNSYSNEHNMYHHEGYNYHETPMIGHDGKPMDTHEVQAAKSKHFAAVHDALARNSHGNSHHYRKRRGAESYVHFSNVVEHEVPVYYHHMQDSHYENGNDDSHNEDEYTHDPIYEHQHDSHGYSYEQIHAPVYGHQDAHYEHEIPVIGHDGTPVDTPEVQHAKAAHLAAHAAAKSKHY